MLKAWQLQQSFNEIKRTSITGSSTFPDIIKMHDPGMSGVDLADHRKSMCNLDCKSSIRFYLNTFFFLMNIVCTNRFIADKIMHRNDVTILDFKTIVSMYLIGRYTNRLKSHQIIKPHQTSSCCYLSSLGHLWPIVTQNTFFSYLNNK